MNPAEVQSGSESRVRPSKWLETPGAAEVLVCAAAFLAYAGTLAFAFVYDDKPQILDNPAVHAWHYWQGYFTSHAWAELYPNVPGNYYRPLFLLWLRLNYALFGDHPLGWHVTTVACHVLAAWMVLVMVRRMSADRWIGLCAAMLFAVHPVHIESVAWIAGVTDPLATVFTLASFTAYLRFRQKPTLARTISALLLFAAALLEKETAAVLLPLVFIYAALYAEKNGIVARLRIATRDAIPFAAIAALYLAARAHALGGLSHAVNPLPWKTIVLTSPSVLWMYVRHLFLPVGLSGFYGVPYVERAAAADFVVPLLALILTTAVLALLAWRSEDPRVPLFAYCWLFLAMIPVLYLPAYAKGDIAHDRYLYLPSVGFVLLAAIGLRIVGRRWEDHAEGIRNAGLILLAVLYLGGTVTQQVYWANNFVFYARGVRIAPTDNLACNNLANELTDRGRIDDAVALYSGVLARDPNNWLANYNLGHTCYKTGRFAEAESFLRKAISIDPRDSDQFIYLGLVLNRQGRRDEAAQYVQKAIALRPSAPGYHFALGIIRQEQRDLPAAAAEFAQELKYNPGNAIAQQFLDKVQAHDMQP